MRFGLLVIGLLAVRPNLALAPLDQLVELDPLDRIRVRATMAEGWELAGQDAPTQDEATGAVRFARNDELLPYVTVLAFNRKRSREMLATTRRYLDQKPLRKLSEYFRLGAAGDDAPATLVWEGSWSGAEGIIDGWCSHVKMRHTEFEVDSLVDLLMLENEEGILFGAFVAGTNPAQLDQARLFVRRIDFTPEPSPAPPDEPAPDYPLTSSARLWDVPEPAAVRELPTLPDIAEMRWLSDLPRGRVAVTMVPAGPRRHDPGETTCTLFDLASGQPTSMVWGGGVAFDVTGSRLLTDTIVPGQGECELWKVSDPEQPMTLVGSPLNADLGLSPFSADGQWVATSTGGEVRLWYADTGEPAARFPWSDGAAFTPDGQTLIGGSPATGLQVVALPETEPAETVPLRGDSAGRLRLSEDGAMVAVARANEVEVWVRGAPGTQVLSGAFARFLDGGRVLTQTLAPPATTLWDAASGERLSDYHGWLTDLASDGGHAVLSDNTADRVVELPSGTSRMAITSLGMRFSPDGRMVFATHEDTTDIWNCRTRRRIATVRGAYHATAGDVLVTEDSSRTNRQETRLYHLATGRYLGSLLGRPVALMESGRIIVTSPQGLQTPYFALNYPPGLNTREVARRPDLAGPALLRFALVDR